MDSRRLAISLLAIIGVASGQLPTRPPAESNAATFTATDPGNVAGGPPAPEQTSSTALSVAPLATDVGSASSSSTLPSATDAVGSESSGAPTAPATQTPTTNSLMGAQGGSSSNNTGLTAGLAVFAVLFAIALAAAIFLFLKRRQDKKRAYLSPAYSSPENGVYTDKSANAQIESLQAQLADANKQLTAVQGTLLAAGQKPQTRDDNTLSREYTQIGTDIVGWAGNYFKASNDPINLTSELYKFLTEHVPSYQALLTNGKSKQLVVRAIVSQVLQESFENGAFFGNSMSAITPLIRTTTAPPSALNNWRSETFFLLEKSDDFTSQRRAAVSKIADKIEQLTYPLAATKQSFQGDPARYKFLEGIIRKASDFALALGKQRANFQLLSEPSGCEFGHATMDDVSQQTDVVIGSDGSSSHPLEGRPIQATVFPLLLKYGNEAGDGYEQITILSKAKVLV